MNRTQKKVITFMTDFGHDEAPGICRGVMRKIAPEADIIDITHHAPSFDIMAGAFILKAALPYMPVGIHVAVVDPGVGSSRRAIAIETGRGDYLVGPDNGLLVPVLEDLGGFKRGVSLTNPKYFLTPLSHTFHGRDIFAPVGAHLAQGAELTEMGAPVNKEDLVTLSVPEPVQKENRLIGTILRFDKFGTAILNIPGKWVAAWLKNGARPVTLAWQENQITLMLTNTFSAVPPEKPCLLVDSSGFLGWAVNLGSAQERYHLQTRETVTISLLNETREVGM